MAKHVLSEQLTETQAEELQRTQGVLHMGRYASRLPRHSRTLFRGTFDVTPPARQGLPIKLYL